MQITYLKCSTNGFQYIHRIVHFFLQPILEYFHYPKKKGLVVTLTPCPQATTNLLFLSLYLPILAFHANESYNTWNFVTGFFYLSCFQDSFMLHYVSILFFFFFKKHFIYLLSDYTVQSVWLAGSQFCDQGLNLGHGSIIIKAPNPYHQCVHAC